MYDYENERDVLDNANIMKICKFFDTRQRFMLVILLLLFNWRLLWNFNIERLLFVKLKN